MDGEGRPNSDQKERRGMTGYQQNAEQNESTIWQRIKDAKQ